MSRQRVRPYERPGTGGAGGGYQGRGYSEDHTIQVDLVLAQITEIGVARVVLHEAEGRPWYREEGVRR